MQQRDTKHWIAHMFEVSNDAAKGLGSSLQLMPVPSTPPISDQT